MPRSAVPILALAAVLGGVAAGGPTRPLANRPATAQPAVAGAAGATFAFGPGGGVVVGATVTVRERPDLVTTTDGDGRWALDGLVVGSAATFVLSAPGRPTTQTATLEVPAAGLVDVSFQTPDQAMVDALAALLGVAVDPGRCQIASTVTRRGHTLGDGLGTHGEPGATVAIDPPVPAGSGPIYFDLAAVDVIWPDRSLTATTDDGGVLFVDVPPGRYRLTAAKPGATIDPVDVECRAGVITNAAPPHGLQVTAGGLDPDEVSPPSTTAVPSTTAPGAPGAGLGPAPAVAPAAAIPGRAAFTG